MNGLKVAISSAVVLFICIVFFLWGWQNLLINGSENLSDGWTGDPKDIGLVLWGLVKLLLIPAIAFTIYWIITGIISILSSFLSMFDR